MNPWFFLFDPSIDPLNECVDIPAPPIVPIEPVARLLRLLPARLIGKGNWFALLLDRIRIKIVVEMDPIDIVPPDHVEDHLQAVVGRGRRSWIEPEIFPIIAHSLGKDFADMIRRDGARACERTKPVVSSRQPAAGPA